MNSKDKGLITEMRLATRLLELGYSVSVPLGDNSRYDLVIEKEGTFSRVQCKTARETGSGCVTFDTANVVSKAGGRQVKKSYTAEEVDYFGVYSPETDDCYLVPLNGSVGAFAFSLRVDKPKNNQQQGVNWAADFLL